MLMCRPSEEKLEFKYLGLPDSTECGVDVEVRHRLIKGAKMKEDLG